MAFPALLQTGPFAPSSFEGIAHKEVAVETEKHLFVPGMTEMKAIFLDRHIQHEMEVTRNVPFLDPGREVEYRPVVFPALHVEYSDEGACIYRSEHCNGGVWQVGMVVQVFGVFNDLNAETPAAAPARARKK